MQWIGVHIITRLELGGAQLATLYEAAHSTFTAAPRYLIYGPGGLLDAEAQALPHVVCLPAAALGRAISARRDVAAIWQVAGLLRQIRRRHPGAKLLVHTHSSKAGIIGRLAAAAVRAECVVHSIHGFGHQPAVMPWITWRGLWLGEVLAARCTQGFTADSAANLARGRAEGIITHHKTQVVHCGIDVAAFAHAATPPQEVRVRLGIEPDHLVVLQVACLKPQKNPLALLELAAALRERFPKVIYLLAGDGELRGALQEARRRLGLEAQVQFLGWRRDVPDLLHAADLLVLTSLWEGLPQVFAQAMAAGKPIVATAVDGAAEAVIQGRTGLLVPPRDGPALAEAVATLLRDGLRRAEFGAAGQRQAAAFSREVMVATLDDFYAEVTSH